MLYHLLFLKAQQSVPRDSGVLEVQVVLDLLNNRFTLQQTSFELLVLEVITAVSPPHPRDSILEMWQPAHFYSNLQNPVANLWQFCGFQYLLLISGKKKCLLGKMYLLNNHHVCLITVAKYCMSKKSGPIMCCLDL